MAGAWQSGDNCLPESLNPPVLQLSQLPSAFRSPAARHLNLAPRSRPYIKPRCLRVCQEKNRCCPDGVLKLRHRDSPWGLDVSNISFIVLKNGKRAHESRPSPWRYRLKAAERDSNSNLLSPNPHSPLNPFVIISSLHSQVYMETTTIYPKIARFQNILTKFWKVWFAKWKKKKKSQWNLWKIFEIQIKCKFPSTDIGTMMKKNFMLKAYWVSRSFY